MAVNPRISIVIPTFNHLDDCLKPCLESIIKYTDLSDIEVIVVANGCTDGTREYVESLGEPFRLIWIDEASGFIKPTNAGIDISLGEYVVLLNNDIVLMPQEKNEWLKMMLKPFESDTKIGITGPYKDIQFFWEDNRIVFREDYVIFYCAMIRRDVFHKIGTLDVSFGQGYQEDIDFCIRAKTAGFRISQVPIDIIYDLDITKDYLLEHPNINAKFPLYHKDRMTFKDCPAKTDGNLILSKHHSNPKYSIIIPTFNHLDDCLKPCLESIIKYTDLFDIEVIIVANGCTDGTREYVESLGEPFKLYWIADAAGYTKATNAGISVSRGEYIVLLNNDNVILDSSRNEWLRILEKPFGTDTLVGITGAAKDFHEGTGSDFLLFFCVMIKWGVIKQLGMLDEIFNPGYGEDIDYCYKAKKAGFKIVQVPDDITFLQKRGSEEHVIQLPLWHKGSQTVNAFPGWDKVVPRNELILSQRYATKNIRTNLKLNLDQSLSDHDYVSVGLFANANIVMNPLSLVLPDKIAKEINIGRVLDCDVRPDQINEVMDNWTRILSDDGKILAQVNDRTKVTLVKSGYCNGLFKGKNGYRSVLVDNRITERSKESIKQFVLESGSYNVSWFGGKKEGSYCMLQNPDEISDFIYDFKDMHIKSYLEIGVADHGVMRLICDFNKVEDTYSIDLGWQDPKFPNTCRDNIDNLKNTGSYQIFRGDSHSSAANDWLDRFGKIFEFVFIDGDHSYDGIIKDTLLAMKYAKPGCIFVYHDHACVDEIARLFREMLDGKFPELTFEKEYVSQDHTKKGIVVFRYEPIKKVPSISIIIPTFNHLDDCLKPCLESIIKYTDLSDIEVIVVANGCTDGTRAYVEGLGEPFRLIWIDEAAGFIKPVNRGIRDSRGEYIVLLNNDTIILEFAGKNGWINILRKPFDDSKVGITGPYRIIHGPTDTIYFPFFCVMIRKTVFDTVGLLDEAFGYGYGEDCDFCARLSMAGFYLCQVPFQLELWEERTQFPIWHSRSVTFNGVPEFQDVLSENEKLLEQRYGKINKCKIYDCFMFYNELDLLEIRLHELYNIIDKFVIVEARYTFQGKPKSLCFEENKDRFKNFLSKIEHVVVDEFPETTKPFDRERFQRDAISEGLGNCSDQDVIIISDVDEIPRAETVKQYRSESGIMSLEQDLFYYSINCKADFKWLNGKILPYVLLKNKSIDQIRNLHYHESIPILPNAGWHLSFVGGVDSIVNKIESFSHQEYDTEEFKNKVHILDCIRNDKDIFKRCPFKYVDIDDSCPVFIKNNIRYFESIGFIKNKEYRVDVSIIIPTFNHLDDCLKPCLESIIKYTDLSDIEVIVVANGCTDGTREYVESLGEPFRLIWMDEAAGFIKATNAGIGNSLGRYIILLNNDTTLLPQRQNEWIKLLKKPFQMDDATGVTGPLKSWREDVSHEYMLFFCVMIQKNLFDRIGLLDEDFGIGYHEDVDFCMRAKKAGYSLIEVPNDISYNVNSKGSPVRPANFPIYHTGGGTFGSIFGNSVERLEKHAQKLLQKHNISTKKTMIYDCFMFFNELEVLEIRLNELDAVVDKFVLVEAKFTHQGKPKPLYFNENKERFGRFLHKIEHIIVEEFPETDDTWVREPFQRNCAMRGLKNCTDEDIIILSDVDEIPKASVVKQYRKEMGLCCIQTRLFYYKLNYLTPVKWYKLRIFPYSELRGGELQDFRGKRDYDYKSIFEDGGWHFSFLGDKEHIRLKIESWGHIEFNNDLIKSDQNIQDALDNGKDIFGRDLQFISVPIDDSYPQYVLKNLKMYEDMGLVHKKRLSTRRVDSLNSDEIAALHSKLKNRHGTYEELYEVNVYCIEKQEIENKIVIDIGANYGYFALRCLEMGAKKVYCFEPENNNFAILCDLTSGFSDVYLYPIAVSDGSINEVHMHSAFFASHIFGNTDGQTAKCISLVDALTYADQNNEEMVLKLDCEGSEYEIILNSPAYIIQKFSYIYIEIHDQVNPKYLGQSNRLISYIESLGFSITGEGPCAGWWDANGDFTPTPLRCLKFRNDRPNKIPKITIGYIDHNQDIFQRYLKPSIDRLSASDVDIVFTDDGASAAHNYNDIINRSKTQYILFLHQDVGFGNDLLQYIHHSIQLHPDFGAMGIVGFDANNNTVWADPNECHEVERLDSCCLLINKDHNLKFDEQIFDDLHAYVEDYCMQVTRNLGLKCYTLAYESNRFAESEDFDFSKSYIKHYGYTYRRSGWKMWGKYDEYHKKLAVKWDMIVPSISIIIPTFNHLDDCLRPCIESIIKNTDLSDIEVIVVANGCTDGTREYVESLGRPFKLIWIDEAAGYTRATNEGIKSARGKYIVLLNNDTYLLDYQRKNEWIDLMLSPFLTDQKIGITGPLKGYCPFLDASKFLGDEFMIFFCVMIRKSLFDEIGLLDEIFSPGAGEDTDFCWRTIAAGYKLQQVPEEKNLFGGTKYASGIFPIFHHSGATRGDDRERVKINNTKLIKKHKTKNLRISFSDQDIISDGVFSADLENPSTYMMLDVRNIDLDNGSVREIFAHNILGRFSANEIDGIVSEFERILIDGGKITFTETDKETLIEIMRKHRFTDISFSQAQCPITITAFCCKPKNISIEQAKEELASQDSLVYDEVIRWNSYNVNRADVEGRNVLDIGGNIGAFAILAYSLGAKRVVSLEPHPGNFKRLTKNVESFVDIIVFQEAVFSPYQTGMSLVADGPWCRLSKNDSGITVKIVDLNEAISHLPLDDNDLVLKIDTEGAEYDILFSAYPKDILRFKTIFAEFHDKLHSEISYNSKMLEKFMIDLGYESIPIVENVAYGYWDFDQQNKMVFTPTPDNLKFNRILKFERKIISKPKVYDCFSFFNELDLLEIRLNELDPYVDHFVLSEMTVTHSGKPKPLYFAENRDRFKKFWSKIIHVIVNDCPDSPDPWVREHFQRNAISRGLQDCDDRDIIIVSDLDEIPRGTSISQYHGQREWMFFEQHEYDYHLNLSVGISKVEPGTFSRITTYGNLKKLGLRGTDLRYRACSDLDRIQDGGWHFSWIGGSEQIIKKIESWAHQELNIDSYKNPAMIERNIQNGIDAFGRHKIRGKGFVHIDSTFPKFIIDNHERFVCNKMIFDILDREPRVAIVMPYYNDKNLMIRSVMGILGQSFRNWTLFLVDDGSSVENRASSVLGHHVSDRIKIIEKTNGGVSSARNAALDEIRNDPSFTHVAYCDSDDIWGEDYLESQLQNIANTDMIYCRAKHRFADGTVAKPFGIPDPEEYPGIDFMLHSAFIFISGVLHRTECLDVGDFDSQLDSIEDWDMWIRIAKAGYEIKKNNCVSITYIVKTDNSMAGQRTQEKTDIFRKKHELIQI